MAPIQLRKATREKTKMRIGIAGTSGSGKTYSALLMASGMAAWEKIALIDTENGSGDLYAHLGAYNVISLQPPYSPERYIEAIEACEKAGIEVIIIDSITHEWDGKGGILEIKDAMAGNSFTAWAKLTPRHNAFINKILQSSAHVICTMRSKQDYVLVEKNGKQVPQKVGLKAITREGVEYEFTLVLDIDINHMATASKDRTEIFMKPNTDVVIPEKVNADTGKKIIAWSQKGITKPEIPHVPAPVLPPKPVKQAIAPDSPPPPNAEDYTFLGMDTGAEPTPPAPNAPATGRRYGTKITTDQTRKLYDVWAKYKLACNMPEADSANRRKALMQEMFGVTVSTSLNEEQGDQLIARIEEMTKERANKRP